jgi:DNA polymerase III alpha subunit/nucleotidyltransferase/DNA polymerase involved in DNA repair
MFPRSIVHLDADAFFASVEQASDPRLRGKPIAVGGEKRGIIASASYEARKCGIYTPMPTVQARRLCPKLILLPGDFEKYELFSRLMFSYAYDFTPDVEIGSIDEGYFDLTGTRKSPLSIATTIRDAIRQALKLSVSEGIAANKLVSQIASKLKKPSAFEYVTPGKEALFLSPLANKWLPGIGPKSATHLNAAGLSHIGQIAQTPIDLLGLLVGSMALQLHNFSLGVDERPVIPVRAPAKSYGEQETFASDTTDEEFLTATLRRMADQLMAKVRADGKSIRTLTVKVRYNDMDEQQASESLNEPTDLETDVYSLTSALLRKAWQRRVSLRLVSLRLSNVYDGRFRSALALDSAACQHLAQQRLAHTVDELREKYGRTVLLRGHDFVLRSKNGHGHEPELQKAEVRGQMANRRSQEYNRKIGYVERQRLGNSFARITASPGVELRFRMELKPTGNSSTALPQSTTKHPRSKITPVPLNLHSYYSFLDSTLSPKTIVELAKRYELPAIALTDTTNLHGAVEFAQAAIEAGIKPILGAELNWHGHRLCLYVQNQTGYHNLCRILTTIGHAGNPPAFGVRHPGVFDNPKLKSAEDSRTPRRWRASAHANGFADAERARAASPSPLLLRGEGPFNPTLPIDQSLLTSISTIESTGGLLAVSPSAELAGLFPGRFYLETNSLEALAKRTAPLPCVASLPIHYELPSDRWKYDIVQSIRTLTLLRQAHPGKRLKGDYHFRTPSEMQKLFAAHPELLAHSLEIAERCSFTFSMGKPQFPSYPAPGGFTPAAFLRHLAMDGLRRRYPTNHQSIKPQLEEELAIILEVGYEEYFLVMWDILQECRRRGIEWITRGSAADSLACYCLEISGVCPIRFELYFRRFLNRDRMALNKLPDIDVDFPHDRKDDVIDLIFEKYGPCHAAVVGGFSTFQSRSAFAEVAKVLGVSEYQVRRLTERLPHFSRASELVEATAETLECRDLPLQQEPYSTALRMARFLDGFPRYPKMHPCGLVLSRQPMQEITPCFTSAKGYPTTHFDMDSVEAVGLIKMDILAQGGLAVMRDVMESVQSPNSKVQTPKSHTLFANSDAKCQEEKLRAGNVSNISHSDLGFRISDLPSTAGPFDDPRVWDLIASGSARAVHHIESPAMISLCRMCNVRDIDTLIAIVSVIRPGAANESKKMEFARRYQRLSPVHYPHSSLEPCLRSTYGLVVYEEHILQMCEAFAGLPAGRADILRRALAKEKTDLINQIQIEFADCARRRGRTETDIAEVWNLVVGFRGYAFCKAHSTAYGVEAYQSAWLKLHCPAEFMAAVLTNGKGFYHPLVYILECHRLGIPLLAPSVNEPGPQFTVLCSSRRNATHNPGLESNGKEVRENRWTSSLGTGTPGLELGSLLTSTATRQKWAIRVPVLLVKGLTNRTKEAILRERERGEFSCLTDFVNRIQPLAEEMEALIRVGAFDTFEQSRTTQYWQFKSRAAREVRSAESEVRETDSGSEPIANRQSPIANNQPWLLPPGNLERLPSVPLAEPDRLQRLRAEEELLGYPVSGHPLELFPDVAWETYCPVNRLAEHVGEQVVTCGLIIEQRLFHQITGEPMKFLTLADWTGIVETELFARTYQSYGLNTIRYRVLEITATIEPFENGRGYTLRVLRANKPRSRL